MTSWLGWRMGGTIRVASQCGLDSAFRLRMPMA